MPIDGIDALKARIYQVAKEKDLTVERPGSIYDDDIDDGFSPLVSDEEIKNAYNALDSGERRIVETYIAQIFTARNTLKSWDAVESSLKAEETPPPDKTDPVNLLKQVIDYAGKNNKSFSNAELEDGVNGHVKMLRMLEDIGISGAYQALADEDKLLFGNSFKDIFKAWNGGSNWTQITEQFEKGEFLKAEKPTTPTDAEAAAKEAEAAAAKAQTDAEAAEAERQKEIAAAVESAKQAVAAIKDAVKAGRLSEKNALAAIKMAEEAAQKVNEAAATEEMTIEDAKAMRQVTEELIKVAAGSTEGSSGAGEAGGAGGTTTQKEKGPNWKFITSVIVGLVAVLGGIGASAKDQKSGAAFISAIGGVLLALPFVGKLHDFFFSEKEKKDNAAQTTTTPQ